MSSTHRFNTFSILTFPFVLHCDFSIYQHCGCNFAVWGVISKSSIIFFFLFLNFMDRRFLLTVNLSNLRYNFFFLIKSRPSPFHLWEVLYNFSFIYVNCQNSNSCPLVPLLSKIMKWGLLEHKYCNITTGDLIILRSPSDQWAGYTEQRDESHHRLDRAGQHRKVWDFIMLFRTAHNLKMMNCLFLEFSI